MLLADFIPFGGNSRIIHRIPTSFGLCDPRMIPIFPFKRDTWYPLAEFARFEDDLLSARRQDDELDHALRLGKEPWMKLRNEELYPVLYFARHLSATADASFKIGVEGADADVELRTGQQQPRRLQITTAGPLWTGENNWGRDHKLHMAKLNAEGSVSGTGPFRREKDGSISNREEAISTEERNPPYLAGLVQALRGKEQHRVPNCELLVHANTYCQLMSREDFLGLAREALAAVPLAGFDTVHIFDSPDGYIVSVSR
jgi:hypothetical protein